MDDGLVCKTVPYFCERDMQWRHVAAISRPYLFRDRTNVTRYERVMAAATAPTCSDCGEPCIIQVVKRTDGKNPAGTWFWTCATRGHRSFKLISPDEKQELQAAGATASNERNDYGGGGGGYGGGGGGYGGGYKQQSSGGGAPQYGYPPGKRANFFVPAQQQQQKPSGPFAPPPGPSRAAFEALLKRVEQMEARVHFLESHVVGEQHEEESQAPDA